MRLLLKGGFVTGLVAVILSFAAPVLVHAQNLTGEIDGVVHDSSGAAVPGATVTIRNVGENIVMRQVTTDNQGQFVAPLLATGTYSVTVDASSFRSETVTGVAVHLDQPVKLPLVLRPGAVSSSVTVSVPEVAPEIENAAAGTLITGTQVRELSLSSRNYQQLLTLQPGITSVVPGTIDRGIISPTGGANAANFSVNGQRVSQNGYFLDGVDMVGHGASQQSQFFPSLDSIQELNILRNTFGAQYGGEGSAIVSMTTKQGTEEFHGGAYGFFRSQVLNANNYFNKLAGIPRPGNRYADFGYQVGGFVPIPKDHRRTFFFVGQEFLREETPTTQQDPNVPTAPQRMGIFTTAVCVQYNANGTCARTSKTIPNIDPTAQAYLTDIIDKVPAPSGATATGDPLPLTFSTASFDNETQTFLRVDHNFNDRLSVFFRYIHEPFNQTVPFGLYGTSGVPGVGTSTLHNGSTNYLGHVTYVLSPKTIIEGGYAQARPFNTATPIGSIASSNSPDIHPTLPYVSTLAQVPNFSINGLAFGATGPYYNPGTYLIMFGNVIHTFGRHTLRVGANFEDLHLGGNSGGNNTGNFAFTAGQLPAGTTTFQQAFANFLLGNASSFTQLSVDAIAWVHGNLYEAYAQDDFHVSSRLTLNAGVRYTLIGAPVEDAYKNNRFFPLVNFDPNTYNPVNAPALTATGQICTTSPCYGGAAPTPSYNALNGIIQGGSTSPFGNAVASQPKLNFAPRLGFALDVFGNGKTAVRGGYGIYYIQTLYGNYQNMVFQNPPNVRNITINPAPGTPNNTFFDNPGLGVTLANVPITPYGTTPQNITPYVQDFSLDVQQELASNFRVDVGYYGNQSVHQIGEEDFNQPAQGAYVAAKVIPGNVVTGSNSSNLNLIRPYKGYGPIDILAPRFMGNYNSLQTSLSKRLHDGSVLNVSYTWAKALTNSQSDRSNGPANINNIAAEYGPTLYNRKNVFNANFVYFVPFFRTQSGIVGHILGGYEFTGIISAASGLPVTVATSSVDPGGLGLLAGGVVGPSNRPDQIANPNVGAAHSRLHWFNVAAFAKVPAGQYRPGDASVGSIAGPGYQTWDLSAFKNVRVWHETNLQFRAEAFNTFNHTNFVGVSSNTTASTFGQVTSAASARVLQVGTKFNF